MVNTRTYILTTDDNVKRIRGRIYSTELGKARRVPIPTACMPGLCYPGVEQLMSASQTQSYVHDLCIDVQDGSRVFSFVVFFKNHAYLPLNRSLPDLGLKGDVVVMRKGVRGALVNMRERDRFLSDFLVARFAQIPTRERIRRHRLPLVVVRHRITRSLRGR